MIKNLHTFVLAAAPVALLSMQLSCSSYDAPESSSGSLMLHFVASDYLRTKAASAIPDTSDFLLKITDSQGGVIYEGSYGSSPEELSVKPGAYTVSVRSAAFDKPAFSAPQYGDDQCVTVPSGGRRRVSLLCRQINSGIRLVVAPEFLTSYPESVIFVESADGRLMYGYTEKRIAYFRPGEVCITMDSRGDRKVVFTRTLESREILTVKMSAASNASSGSGFSIAVDTTRIWSREDFAFGAGDSSDGSSEEKALDVARARSRVGEKGVWVYGYIVGSFRSSGNIVFESPFPSATNMAIGGRPSSASLSSCLSVELKKGAMRDNLNLLDNPGGKGRKLYLKGEIVEAYYGIPGIKNVSAYKLE